ncbi:MAG: site-2 protease family protein, partial [Lactococcus garvieae]
MIQTLVTFIIVFGIIVVVHEYGHLFFAKRAGILVREFSIGMG